VFDAVTHNLPLQLSVTDFPDALEELFVEAPDQRSGELFVPDAEPPMIASNTYVVGTTGGKAGRASRGGEAVSLRLRLRVGDAEKCGDPDRHEKIAAPRRLDGINLFL
jgi:hypothetical protein